jgi:hypothetical protein
MAVDCNATTEAIETSCGYMEGVPFFISVHATSAGSGYTGYQVKPSWDDPKLGYISRTAAEENQWPPTCIGAKIVNAASLVFGCASFPPVLSSYTGPLAEFEMVCEGPGQSPLTLVPRIGDNQGGTHFIIDDFGTEIDPFLANATVECISAGTSTPTATNTPGSSPTPTDTPPPGPTTGAMAVDCDASTGGIQANCTYGPNATFSIAVHATDAGPGYVGYQAKPSWVDANLNYVEGILSDENQWPPCVFAARTDGPTFVTIGCAGVPPASTYTGELAVLQMQCQDAGTTPLTLLPNPGGTNFVLEGGTEVNPALTHASVTCQSGASPTPTDTNTPLPSSTPTPTETPGPTVGAMAVDCDASTGGIDSDCTYPAGAQFTIGVNATDAGPGYVGYQTKTEWTNANLEYIPAVDFTTENQWPVSCFQARTFDQSVDPSFVTYGCAAGPPASNHIGRLVILQMQCETEGTTALTLATGAGGTNFVLDPFAEVTPAITNASVTCEPGATNTPTITATRRRRWARWPSTATRRRRASRRTARTSRTATSASRCMPPTRTAATRATR